jgi:DNA-binding transcriptional ArsR family regulator
MARSHAHAAEFRETLRLFALFGHPLRTIIFQRLAKTPMTAGELAKTLPVGRIAVVQHLKKMEAARLVAAGREGKKRRYRVTPDGLLPLIHWCAGFGAAERGAVPARAGRAGSGQTHSARTSPEKRA